MSLKDCTSRGQALQDAKLKKVWYKQAYLMAYMDAVTAALRPSGNKLNGWNPSKYIKLISTSRQNDAIVNRLTVSEDVMTFFDGTQFDYSQVVPHIEIHKVYIKSKEDQEEVLFPFTAFTDFDREWSRKNLNTPFRGQDAGIQSVALQMDGLGKNPAQANIMHATVKFVFNDVKTLFKVWKTRADGPTEPGVQYSDLIRYPHKLQDPKTKDKSKPAAFRIRIQVGWNMYNKKGLFDTTLGDVLGNNSKTSFADAVERSKISFIGDMHTHDMDFKEDGSVVLTVKYRGALDMAFSSPQGDLMNNFTIDQGTTSMRDLKAKLSAAENAVYLESLASNGSDRAQRMKFIMSLQKKVADAEKSDKDMKSMLASTAFFTEAISQYSKTSADTKNIRTILASAGGSPLRTSWQAIQVASQAGASKIAEGTGVPKTPGEVLDDQLAFEKDALLEEGGLGAGHKKKLIEATSKIRSQIKSLEGQAKAKFLFTFVDEMIEKNRIGWINTAGNVAFEQYAEYQDLLEKGKLAEAEQAYGDVKASPSGTTGVGGKDPAEYAKEYVKAAFYPQDSAEAPTAQPGDKVMFFLLGDLISTIFDHGTFGLGIEELSPEFRIVFGNLDYYPPRTANPINFSLYDLPISLEYFINFISTKIVGEQLSSYNFGLFLKDMIKWLMDRVTGTLGPADEGPDMVRKRPEKSFKIELTSMDIPKEITKSDISEGGVHTNPILILSDGNKNLLHVAKKAAITDLSNVWLLQAHRSAPFRERIKRDQKANPVEDRKDGVFHFMVGGPNRGLLKSIKFSEHKNSNFSTAMWRNAQGDGTASARGIIRPAKYTCEMKLIGNPFFYVGQYFYVNTALISNNYFEKELIMNGGYYVVLSVKNDFAAGKWETTIKGYMEIADFVVKRAPVANTVNTKDAPSLAELESPKPQIWAGNETKPPQPMTTAIG